MKEQHLLSCLNTGQQDCADLHEWMGVRNVYILHLVVRGAGYFQLEGKTHPLREGQLFLIYPGMAVRYYPDKDNPYAYKWVDFTGDLGRRCCARRPFPPPTPSRRLCRRRNLFSTGFFRIPAALAPATPGCFICWPS